MPLIDPTRTVRIDLPTPGEWVEVREQLSKGDEVRAQKAALRGDPVIGPDGTVREVPLDLEAAQYATLELAIVAWSFPDPVTPENIRRLDPDSHDYLVGRLNQLYRRRTPEETKNSSAASPTLS